jgi:REP element-mobilizing transposase RayT
VRVLVPGTDHPDTSSDRCRARGGIDRLGVMPRAPRFHEPCSYRHVTARGNDREALFRDDADRWRFLGILRDVTRDADWRCLAFCLMTTHYHLLVQEREVALSRTIHLLHSRYVRAFNLRHGRRGHVFGGRYGVATISDNAHLLTALRYIAVNPVEAGLCAGPADWTWSSYAGLIGVGRPWSFVSTAHVLSLYAPGREQAMGRIRQYIEPVPGTEVPGT